MPHGTFGGNLNPCVAIPCPVVPGAAPSSPSSWAAWPPPDCVGAEVHLWMCALCIRSRPLRHRGVSRSISFESLPPLRGSWTIVAGDFNCCALGDGRLDLTDGSLQLDISAESEAVGPELPLPHVDPGYSATAYVTHGACFRQRTSAGAPRRRHLCRLHCAGIVSRPPIGVCSSRGRVLPGPRPPQADYPTAGIRPPAPPRRARSHVSRTSAMTFTLLAGFCPRCIDPEFHRARRPSR